MKFTKILAPDFDLEQTLNSGQVFHWQKVGDGFVGTIGDLPVYVEQGGEFLKVRFGGTPKPARETRALPGIIRHYFALGSSVGGDLRFVSEGPGHERCSQFLSRVTDHSATEVGMSRHIHLFVDETGGAYSPNFDGAPETIWRATEDRMITSCTRSLRRGDLRKLRRRSCAIASSATAPKICVRRRGSSAPARRISRRGRRCLMPSSENNCARCQAWGRRLQIA